MRMVDDDDDDDDGRCELTLTAGRWWAALGGLAAGGSLKFQPPEKRQRGSSKI